MEVFSAKADDKVKHNRAEKGMGPLSWTAYVVFTFQNKFLTSQPIFKETPSLKVFSMSGLCLGKHNDTQTFCFLYAKYQIPEIPHLCCRKVRGLAEGGGSIKIYCPTSNMRLVKMEARKMSAFGSVRLLYRVGSSLVLKTRAAWDLCCLL